MGRRLWKRHIPSPRIESNQRTPDRLRPHGRLGNWPFVLNPTSSLVMSRHKRLPGLSSSYFPPRRRVSLGSCQVGRSNGEQERRGGGID